MKTRIRSGCVIALAGVLCALAALVAHAHIVYGTKTLLGLTAEADLVVRGRVVAVDVGPSAGTATEEATSAETGKATRTRGSSRPSVAADVLEVLKGSFDAPRVRFAQHGHGVAHFEPGEETLIFLVDIERSRELDALGAAGVFDWVSLQEHDDEYRLEPGTRASALAAVRGYAAAEAAAGSEQRVAALHDATLTLLTSGDARLASSALRDLVVAPTLSLISAEDLPALERVLDDPGTSMGVRVGLLHELDRRGLVQGPTRWLGLLAAEGPASDRVTAIRGAGAIRSDAVRARLVELLSDPNPEVAAAAAIALGEPGNRAAVEPLAAALSNDSASVRMAAIRGLGAIGTPEAEAVLQSAAASHPDAATQRRARAEVVKRDSAR